MFETSKIEHKQVLLHYSSSPLFTLLIIYPLFVNFAPHERRMFCLINSNDPNFFDFSFAKTITSSKVTIAEVTKTHKDTDNFLSW
jgi:hypothetical protein